VGTPDHVHVFPEPESLDLGHDVHLIASPLRQKLSTIDPSLKLAELASGLPKGAIKVGITHGALAIEGKHQPNDFPIALNAASRAGLDYLAVGHWHNWLEGIDDGRIVMPGTPEPDSFDLGNCGKVALVEIPGAGDRPTVKALPVATFSWVGLGFDFLSAEADRARLEREFSSLATASDRTVVRVSLSGTASPGALSEVRAWIEARIKPFLISQIVDRTKVALSAAELQDLQARHPILALVLADIDQLEVFATGRTGVDRLATGVPPISLSDARALLAAAKIDLTALTIDHFAAARQVLLQTVQEVSP
jgi:DNA repair exonuclease SbcCD nuclease subunit